MASWFPNADEGVKVTLAKQDEDWRKHEEVLFLCGEHPR